MALAATSGLWVFPPWDLDTSTTPGFTAILLDSATEYVSTVIPIRQTGTLSKVGFRADAVTAAGTIDLRIETVAGRGPSGTLYQTSGGTSIPVTAANTWYTAILDSGVAVTIGTPIAVKLQMTTTAGAIGSLNISVQVTSQPMNVGYPYQVRFQGTTTSRAHFPLVLALEYSDGSFPFTGGVSPISAVSTNTYNSGTAARDEVGAVFSFSHPVQCHGIACFVALGAGGTSNAVIYDQDTTTVLASVTLDPQQVTMDNGADWRLIYLPSPITLAVNGSYRVTMVPLTTTNISTYSFIGSSTAVMSQFPNGASFLLTQRVNSGAWTDGPREYPMIGLLTNGFDDGAGGATTVNGGAWGF